jgi:2-octaprenyl-6-methoxyphenol hydroxylase
VSTVKLAEGHEQAARQMFLETGPFALLPLKDNHANLIWTEQTLVAEALMRLSDAEFEAEIKHRLGHFTGEFTLAGPRFSYPLKMAVADSFVSNRIALAGDAAHSIHPLAGQGLNLGLKDVAELVEAVVNASYVGLDIGSPQTLNAYEEARRSETIGMTLGLDVLSKLFNAPAPLRKMAGLGMEVFGKSSRFTKMLSEKVAERPTQGQPKLFLGERVIPD